MTTATKGTFQPARLVALVVIAAVAVGLVYLRLSPPGDEVVSVPEGAKAGDLILESCTYPTEDGDYAADCGTLVAPENRRDPQSRLIAIPVIRIRARSNDPAEPIFYLEGGPGITNMNFVQANRYVGDRDVVVVGYRGVDGSVRLECPEVDSALAHSSDFLGEGFFRAYGDAYGDCAERLTEEGVDLAGYGLPQEIDDVEAVRVALGYDHINLLSQSAGTRTAQIYSWLHPKVIHRSVMIGVNPPGNFLWHERTMNEQIDRYSAYCARDSSCSERTDDLAALMQGTVVPDRWLFMPINESNVWIFTFYGLMESSSTEMLNAPATFDAWMSASEGDAGGFWLQSFLPRVFHIPFVWGQYAAAATGLDAEAAREYFSSGEPKSMNIAYAGTAFAWGGGRLVDGWPSAPYGSAFDRVKTSDVETLLIGGELDTSTPPQVATEELLPYLRNGHEVVLPGIGHTASFFAVQPEAGTHLINTFFDSGRVDDSLYRPESVDFTPSSTLPGMAKVVVGVLIGFAFVAVVSLLWMARRGHTRGAFGRKARTALRVLYPVVAGLGGWCLGALIVVTTMPAVTLDNELLGVVAIGLPVGLGIYWVWVDRAWPATVKRWGSAAVLGGALLGAMLGINATDGIFIIATVIVGAAAGGNLGAILFEMSSRAERADRSITKTNVADERQLELV